MNSVKLIQRMPSVALGAQELDRTRALRVESLLEEHPDTVRSAREACAILLEQPCEQGAQAELSRCAERLLSSLRAANREQTALSRMLALADDFVRSDMPELLDRPGVPERFKELTMLALQRANVRSGSYDHWLSIVEELVGRDARSHVYDLAAGTGGFSRHVARAAAHSLRMTSSDRSARYVGLGMRAAARARIPDITWEVCDALDLRAARTRGDVDLFLCTQAAHHFSPGPLVQLFAHAIESAPRGLLVIDLLRSASTALGTALLAALTAPWPGLIFDGFQSARRAYTPAEFTLLARLSGAQNVLSYPLGPAWCVVHAQKY